MIIFKATEVKMIIVENNKLIVFKNKKREIHAFTGIAGSFFINFIG